MKCCRAGFVFRGPSLLSRIGSSARSPVSWFCTSSFSFCSFCQALSASFSLSTLVRLIAISLLLVVAVGDRLENNRKDVMMDRREEVREGCQLCRPPGLVGTHSAAAIFPLPRSFWTWQTFSGVKSEQANVPANPFCKELDPQLPDCW